MATRIVAGRVIRVSAEARTLTCLADDAAIGQVEAINMGAILGSMLGIRTAYMPAEGSKVLLAADTKTGYTYTLGEVPELAGADPSDFRGALFGANFSKASTQGVDGSKFKYRSARPPLDIIDGEVDMTNLFDVGVSFLTGMTRLKAGEGAVVEACLLDSLVRIISRNYEHTSPLGSFRINTDGDKCTAEFRATSHEHEGLGLDNPNAEKVGIDANQAVYPDLMEGTQDTIRARLQAYTGWLGDFVSLWVTDAPRQVESTIQHLAKSRVQLCQDGSVLVQSLADISLERVYRITVPIRKLEAEDPGGDNNFGNAVTDSSREWTPSSADTAFHAAYQMREYARWFANEYSMVRFRELTKDFEIAEATDSAQITNKYHSGDEKDKAVGGEIGQVYACIRILRSGEIVLIDGENSSVTMAGGNIHMSAKKSCRIEAGEAIELIGKNVRILASKDLELTAGRGFIMSAGKWLKGLCLSGGILLQTKAGPAGTLDWQEHESVTDPDIPEEHRIDGITIQSAGKLAAHGTKSLLLTTGGNIRAKCNTFFQHATSVKLVDFSDKVGIALYSYGGAFIHGSLNVLRQIVANFMSHVTEFPGGAGRHKNHVGHYVPLGSYAEEFIDNTTTGQPAPSLPFLVREFSFGITDTPAEIPQSHTQRELVMDDNYEYVSTVIFGDDGSRPALLNPSAEMITFPVREAALNEGGRGSSNPNAVQPSPTPLRFMHLKDPPAQ